jgi:hypothetical protein
VEAIAAARDGGDHRRISAAIADRAPRQADRARDRAVRDHGVRPDPFEDLLLRDDPLALARQVEEELEHLRLQQHHRAATPELEPLLVELVLSEGKDHPVVPAPLRAIPGRQDTPIAPSSKTDSGPDQQPERKLSGN